MKTNRPTVWLAILGMLGGCTTSLAVHRLDPQAPVREGAPARTGIGYALPFTQFKVTETWQVASCTPGNVSLSVRAEAEIEQADDTLHQYLIDPESLQTLLTRSEFNAAFHDGSNMLKSVNATIEDRTAAVIGNVVRTVVSLAPVIAGAPLALDEADNRNRTPPACTGTARDALDEAKLLKGEVNEATRKVNEANAAVVDAARDVADMGAAVDEVTRARYGAAVRQLNAQRAVLTLRSAQLANALAPITFQRVIRWPERSDCFASLEAHQVDSDALESWFTNASPAEQPQIYMAIERAGPFGQTPTACPAAGESGRVVSATYRDPPERAEGLRYRMPAQGRLVICSARPCASQNVADVLAVVEGPVAQLGYVNLLRVRARTFGSNTFAAEFRTNGSLTSVGYAQKAAPLEGATETGASAASSLAPLFDPTQQLARQTAYLEQLKAQRDALAAVTPAAANASEDERTAIEANTSLINARIAQLQAEITLERLRSGTARQ
jgi:hypothetical protein